MNISDGGFRPAYNAQFDTTADVQGAVVGVSVSARGYDYGEMTPMLDQVESRTGDRPTQKLGDGGYVQLEDIRLVEQGGTQVFAPVPKRSAEERAFLERIRSDECKAIYRQRGEGAEITNAHAKTRHGLVLMLLRGAKGALAMALLAALAKDVQVLAGALAAHAEKAPIAAVTVAT
jgi:Transposase DDE domain